MGSTKRGLTIMKTVLMRYSFRDVRISTLTPLMLKQIRGKHGCIAYKCPICRKMIDEKDIGKAIVSYYTLNSETRKINPNKQKQCRDYVHGHCFNSTRMSPC